MTEDANGNGRVRLALTEQQIEQVEQDFKALLEVVRTCQTNHLPHIQTRVDELHDKLFSLVKWQVGVVVTMALGFSGIIGSILL